MAGGSTGTSDIQVQLSVTSVRAVPLCTAGSSSQAAGESGEQHCQRYADMRYKLMTWNPGSDIWTQLTIRARNNSIGRSELGS